MRTSVTILIAALLALFFGSCQWLRASDVKCTVGGDSSCAGLGFCDPIPRDDGEHYCDGQEENLDWPPGGDDDDTADDDDAVDDDDTSADDDDTSADDDDTSADDDDTSGDDDDSVGSGEYDWHRIEGVTTASLTAVAFSSINDGWAVGSDSTILRTQNGGWGWDQQDLGSWVSDLNDVVVYGPSAVFAVGSGGTLFITLDAGASWTMDSGFLSSPDVDLLSAYIGGPNQRFFYISTSGGQVWSFDLQAGTPTWSLEHQTEGGTALTDLSGFAETVWAVGDEGLVKVVGVEEGSVYPVGSPSRGLAMVSLEDAWIVGDGGTLQSVNAGETWQATTGNSTPSNGVDFVDPDHGWVVGQNHTLISATPDLKGSLSWSAVDGVQLNLESNDHLRGVDFFDVSHGAVVGDNGVILIARPPDTGDDGDDDLDGYTENQGDCNDADPTFHPGADEICDGLDNDCNGLDDDDPIDGSLWYPDLDGDGFGAGTSVTACEGQQPADRVDNADDCDDDLTSGATNFPGALELCDGIDNDCNGTIDDGFADFDGDGDADCVDDDDDGDGDPDTSDCDDNNPGVNASATEVCDGIDNNCASGIDEGFDADGDGVTTCGPDGDPATTADNDCDDSSQAAHPGLSEQHPAVSTTPIGACEDGYDNDCDGLSDCDDGDCSLHSQCTSSIPDSDADGFGDHGWGGLDCNDFDASVHPGAWDAQGDGVDSDCDGDDNTTSAASSAVGFRSGCQSSDADYPFVVGAAGDFDGNGVPDLVFGDPYWSSSNCGAGSNHVGRSYLWRSEDPSNPASQSDSLPEVGQSVVLGSVSAPGQLSGMSLVGSATGPLSGSSVALNGDINNDGFDDLLIGVPAETVADSSGSGNTYTNGGAVYLILGKSAPGGSNSLNTEALRTGGTSGNSQLRYDRADFAFFGFGEDDRTGSAVAWAGDINGDDHDEILIGAPGYGIEEEGRVYLLDGGTINYLMGSGTAGAQCHVMLPGGTISLADHCRNLGDSAIGEHTFDGDGPGISGSGAMLGGVIAAGRDLTGDGKPDFALGSTTANDDQGAVYVFFSDEMSPAPGTVPFPAPTLWDLFDSARTEGVSAVASTDRHFELTVEPSNAGFDFAMAVTLVPDLATDGGVGAWIAEPDDSAELLIGMPATSQSAGNSRAYLVHGAEMVGNVAGGSDVLTVPQSSSIITFMGGATTVDGFGSALAAGDVDGDSYGDILICAPNDVGGGRGYLYEGDNTSGSADAVFVAESSGDHFCSSATLPGNVDGFGGPDILIGARNGAGTGSGVGRAYLFQNPQ